MAMGLHDVVELEEEPAVNFSQLMNPLNVVVLYKHGVGNGKQPRVGWNTKCLVEIIRTDVRVEARIIWSNLTNSFL